MAGFHDYERTRKRQALAILVIVGIPAVLVSATLGMRAGHGWLAVAPGLIAAVSIYAAWDLSRVIVDPTTMHVEAVDVSARIRTLVRTAGIMILMLMAWGGFAWWIDAMALAAWALAAVIIALLVQGVHLAVTDTSLASGPASPRSPALDTVSTQDVERIGSG